MRPVVMCLLACLVLAGCSKGSASPTTPAAPPGSGTSVDVGINGDAYLPSGTAVFAPETITVDAGATVVWRNNDQTPHTTTADEGQWDSSVGAGSSFSRQFMTSGTYEYHCRIHAYMTGTVVVR